MQPFRFFDLPIELQQHILSLYYGNTAIVKARFEPTFSQEIIMESYVDSSSDSDDETAFSISPFLVSRRFNNEALYALQKARNNTMALICPTLVPGLLDHWLLDTATSASVEFNYNFDTAVFREKLPNLKTLHLEIDAQYWSPWHLCPYHLHLELPNMQLPTLADILRGKHDEKLATATRRHLYNSIIITELGLDPKECFRGITIPCDESEELFNSSAWRDEMHVSGLLWATLWVQYEFKGKQARVNTKWFENGSPNEYGAKTPEEALRLIDEYHAREYSGHMDSGTSSRVEGARAV